MQYLLSQILYTGDYSRQEDRHLMCAEMPTVKPDIVIIVRNLFIYKESFVRIFSDKILYLNGLLELSRSELALF